MLGGRSSRGIGYIISFLKIFFLIAVALYLPQFFVRYISASRQTIVPRPTSKTFKLGLENISESLLGNLISEHGFTPKIGLVTNQTGVDRAGKKNVDILAEKGIDISVLLYPLSPDTKEYMKEFSIPSFPLYQDNAFSLNRVPFSLVDVIIFDIQDIGTYQYSFINTLFDIITIAADTNKMIVILDRPNLFGANIEGISAFVPVRYGITVGELAHYFNQYILEKPAQLQVIPMVHYTRAACNYESCFFLSQSRTTSINSCYGFSFLGLLADVGPFNIGLNTDKAFECLLLPNSLPFSRYKWYELQEKFKNIGIKSKLYSYFNEQEKEQYTGLQFFFHNIHDFSSLNALLTVLTFFNQSGVPLTFSAEFDDKVGTSKIRECVQGKIERSLVEKELNKDLQLYYHRALNSLLYQPLPKLIHV